MRPGAVRCCFVILASLALACGKSANTTPTSPSANTSASTPAAPPPTTTTTIGGRVTNFSGAAVSNAVVEILSPAIDAGLATRSDAAGQLRLSGIRSVTFTVRYSHDSHESRTQEYTFQLGTQRTDLETRMVAIAGTGPDGFVFNIDPAVSDVERAAIRDALDFSQHFFQDVFGRRLRGSIAIRITAEVGQFPAFAGSSSMTFNTRHQVWTGTSDVNKRKITIHEAFHILQEQNGLQGSNPRWFVEGTAEFVGYQGVSFAGLLAYSTGRRCQLYSMAQGVDPSLTLRSGGIPPSGGYWLAFMGIDFMSNSDVRQLGRIISSTGTTWDQRLLSATGQTGDHFYDRFEAERAKYPAPSSYECPR